MAHQVDLVIIGVSVGLAIGILVTFCAFVAIRLYRKRLLIQHHNSESRVSSLPIRTNGIGTSMEPSVSLSNSEIVHNSQHSARKNRSWWGHHDKDIFASVSGIPRYSYKYALYSIPTVCCDLLKLNIHGMLLVPSIMLLLFLCLPFWIFLLLIMLVDSMQVRVPLTSSPYKLVDFELAWLNMSKLFGAATD